MANNKIEVYQNNDKDITCTVSGLSITGYTPYLTIKRNTNGEAIISKTGTIADPSTAMFSISNTDTSIAAGDYVYDVVIETSTYKYTIVKDRFSVLDGVR